MPVDRDQGNDRRPTLVGRPNGDDADGLPGSVSFGPRAERKRGNYPSDLGAGERIRTTDLPFTRSTARCTVRTSFTVSTSHRTDGTRCAGIIRRIVPRTVPRPRPPRPRVSLLCVISLKKGGSDPGKVDLLGYLAEHVIVGEVGTSGDFTGDQEA
jgi:hypothetical protein